MTSETWTMSDLGYTVLVSDADAIMIRSDLCETSDLIFVKLLINL
jgi:hypothetical protein